MKLAKQDWCQTPQRVFFYVFFPVHFDMNNKYHNTTDQTFEIVQNWTKDPPYDRRMLILIYIKPYYQVPWLGISFRMDGL